MKSSAENEEKLVHIASSILDLLFGPDGGRIARVCLWDGSTWPDNQPRPVTLVLKHSGSLNAMFRSGTELGLAEAYLYDDFDILGDIESAFSLYEILIKSTCGWRKKLPVASMLMQLPLPLRHVHGRRGPARLTGSRHSVSRDQKAVTYHYDVSNDFYSLWLDRNMVYSCAYFSTPEEGLEEAQDRKLDYICRKLRLRAGQRLLDLGCGWGGLLIHAANHYGVDATGITLSKPQAELANTKIAEAGLKGTARAKVLDYREINPETDKNCYDALVSVGMFEHVGTSKLPEYFSQASRLLKSGGVFLNHGIACVNTQKATDVSGSYFNDTYVFPDGELSTISNTLCAAEAANFEVRDVESLREHYMLTLRHWVHRLENHHEEILRYVDEPTYRVWRLFMSASAYGFSAGTNNVYQTLLIKPDEKGRSGLPLTREDWYR
jgi:cyclopropane-fatty-acyl-phospholipid synthase